jgi:hypothetical protein
LEKETKREEREKHVSKAVECRAVERLMCAMELFKKSRFVIDPCPQETGKYFRVMEGKQTGFKTQVVLPT